MGRPFVELAMFKIMTVSSTAAPNPPPQPQPQPQGEQKLTQSPLAEKLGDLDTVPCTMRAGRVMEEPGRKSQTAYPRKDLPSKLSLPRKMED